MSAKREAIERLIEFEEADEAIFQGRIRSLEEDLREECGPFMEPHWESRAQRRLENTQRKLENAQANIAALKWSLSKMDEEGDE